MSQLNHLAIIMDGNGRWAEQRGLPRWKGHEMGIRSVQRLTEAAGRRGISVVTLFAFSSENWKRPEKEVRILFALLYRYLATERERLTRNGIRISGLGRRDRIPGFARKALVEAEVATRNCSRLHLRIALDYGSRYEIAEAAQLLARDVMNRKLQLNDITEEYFTKRISRDEVGDPDLIIRTAGERRLSNFLLWQAAYSELYFSQAMWPDFDETDLDEALADFYSRSRKFGAVLPSEAMISEAMVK
jgi:undecaprenyl diphosphate synthase